MDTIPDSLLKEISERLPETSSIVSVGFVKLYSCDSRFFKWKDSKLEGCICLIIDRALATVFIRLYSTESFVLLFENELFYGFSTYYMKHSSRFYSYPVPGGVIGIYFISVDEASTFASKISVFSPKEPSQEKHEEIEVTPCFSFKKKKTEESVEIGQPYAVQLISRVLWDNSNQRFNLSQLPPDLKRIFKNAGITKKELKDSRTAASIFKEIVTRNSINLSDSRNSFIDISPIKSEADEEVEFTNYLAERIAERRAELTKYDIESSVSYSDWTDED